MRRFALFATALFLFGAPVLHPNGEAFAGKKTKKEKAARAAGANNAAHNKKKAAQSAKRKPEGKPKPPEKERPVDEPSDAPTATAAAAAAAAPPPSRGPTRIDFDDRLIQGQTNRSGAVYLYDRKELKTRSMLKTRDSFREEIVGSVYDS